MAEQAFPNVRALSENRNFDCGKATSRTWSLDKQAKKMRTLWATGCQICTVRSLKITNCIRYWLWVSHACISVLLSRYHRFSQLSLKSDQTGNSAMHAVGIIIETAGENAAEKDLRHLLIYSILVWRMLTHPSLAGRFGYFTTKLKHTPRPTWSVRPITLDFEKIHSTTSTSHTI